MANDKHRRMCKVQLGLHVYGTCLLPGAGGGYLSTAGGRQKWLYRIEKD